MNATNLLRRYGLGLTLLAALSNPAPAAESRLADAAEQRDRAALDSLLANKLDVNAAQPDGMTALHWAAYHDDVELCRRLLAAGADVQAENRYGVKPLSLACMNGNAAIVELLLRGGADANTTLRGGETALMTAARTGKLDPVKALLARGAQVDAKERRGQTAIMWAAAEGHASVVETLIHAGGDFRSPLNSGFTPLFFAVREGHIEVVDVLLKAGADVNTAMQPRQPAGKGPRKGTSPLILAVENGHFELALALLKAGADPNDQRSGFTALHTISWVRKPGRGDEGDPAPIGSGNLSSLQLVKELVAHGADVNAPLKRDVKGQVHINTLGATPFLFAAITADTPLMRRLVELGANPLQPNADGTTPLMVAAGVGARAPGEEAGTESEALEAVRYLVAQGADVNAVDANGETAMHGAAYKSLPKVAQYLAEHGAKVNIWNRENKFGWTPLVIAAGYRHGNFKPSPETMDAIQHAMLAQGVVPPSKPMPGRGADRKNY